MARPSSSSGNPIEASGRDVPREKVVQNEFATGSYASTALLALPPAINTAPPLSAIAAWPVLETPIEFDVAAVVPLGGVPAVNVNSSAVADPPPAIRTLPLERSVAVHVHCGNSSK